MRNVPRATLSVIADFSPNRTAEHLWAVLRLDPPYDGKWDRVVADPGMHVTVKELVPTQEEALSEIARLSALASERDCVYFCQITRLYSGGRGLDADAQE